ncbi:MAG: hypothetical protein MUO50_02035 [Longimicrobiales bacterium]|nr:hypothetical protein [Longimicrobiales bacterium]
MGLFEFLIVLVSVVIGLGLTEILTGVANLLRARDDVRVYWIHVLFQCGVFFALLQQWWEFWDMEGMGEISFLAVLAILAPPIFLFLIANLLYPKQAEGADLEKYYYRQAPLLWGLVIAGTLVGTFLQPLVFGGPVFHPANISGIPMLVFCFVLAGSKNRRVHSVLGPIIIMMVLLDTILANPAISTG